MEYSSLYLPKLEIRTGEFNKIPTYIVRGYATVPDYVYTYKKSKDRSFKEFFSQNALTSLKNKIKSEKVFVDTEHILATTHSADLMFQRMKEKTGVDFSDDLEKVKQRFIASDAIPMFKVNEIEVDEKGLFVEIRANPFYRDLDEEHKNYFDSVWGSLETGFINGMSLNFRPVKTIQVNNELTQIEDIDLYGISLTGSPANDMATITEVMVRSMETIRGEEKCKPKRKKLSSLMM